MKKSLKYLNGVLTLIAVLLTLNLWAMWNVMPGGQVATMTSEVHAQGVMNAAAQRNAMVKELKKVNKEVVLLKNLFVSGKAKVLIKNVDEKKSVSRKSSFKAK